jgi:hypothetical protein
VRFNSAFIIDGVSIDAGWVNPPLDQYDYFWWDDFVYALPPVMEEL